MALVAPHGKRAAATPPSPATSPSGLAAVDETPLGSVAAFDTVRNVAITTDGNHLALLGVRGGKRIVALDGHDGPAFDWVVPDSLAFSPGAARIAYVVQSSTDTRAVIDGAAGKAYHAIDQNRVTWSGDGTRYAYAATLEGGGSVVVADGVEGARFDSADSATFSPNGLRLAYRASRGNKHFIVADEKPGKSYDDVAQPAFSPDGRHVALRATENGKDLLVLDGQEGKAYDAIRGGPLFSADGSRVVAVVAQDKKLIVVVNGRESPPYDALIAYGFSLSPDGRRIAYAVKDAGKQFVVIDGVPQPPQEYLGNTPLLFSPDSKHLAYQATIGGAEHVILDGKPLAACDAVLPGTPTFSPDSARLAYGAKRGGSWRMIVDGVEDKPYELVEPPHFSPDGKRIAYRAAVNHKPLVVVDGVESPAADRIGPLSFGPDGRQLAYVRMREGAKAYLVVDGAEVAGPFEPATPDLRVTFDDAATMHLIVMHGQQFVRLRVRV